MTFPELKGDFWPLIFDRETSGRQVIEAKTVGVEPVSGVDSLRPSSRNRLSQTEFSREYPASLGVLLMSMTVMRRITFNAGHRLLGHEGKCKYFHGHNYAAEFYVRPLGVSSLDAVGRVIDFSELKSRLKGWIDENWDHGFLLHENDSNGVAAIQQVEPSRYFLLPDNPTAETMADYLLNEVCPVMLADLNVECCKVVLWETSESCAIAELPVPASSDPALRDSALTDAEQNWV